MLQQIPVGEVKVGERLRRLDDGKVVELMNSYELMGVINPISVDQEFQLLAGAHRLEAARRLGWETIEAKVFDEDDLNKAKDFFDQKEIPCKFSKRQFQGNTIELDDIVGVPLEFCATMDQKEPLMRRFDQHTGGRCAFLDHIQISTHDVQSAFDWYSDLGFRLTEYTAADGTDELWGVWLKRKYNTQDVVYSNGEGPMLHHIALHTPEIANVIHCADAMASLGLAENMDRPPGRHGIGNAFFIYFRDPDGHRVEIFTRLTFICSFANFSIAIRLS